MTLEAPKRYHTALISIHWVMAILIFINLYLGIVLFENHAGGPPNMQAINAFVGIHMALGIFIILLLVVRFIIRVRARRPLQATAGNIHLDRLARVVHYGLYVVVLAVTILGLVLSLQIGRFQSTFLGARNQFGEPPGGLPRQGTPGLQPNPNGTLPAPGSGFQPGQGGPGGRRGGFFNVLVLHEWSAYLLLALVTLHILAALYHQFFLKDRLIARMWFKEIG